MFVSPLTDFDNHIETRVYDQARGMPLSITEGSGTAQERTRTYTWDSRFLKPSTVTQPVETPTGTGSQLDTYTYDTMGNLTAWSLAVTGPGSYSVTRTGSATYNAFGEPLTLTNERGKVTTMTYDTQGNRLSSEDALGHVTTFGGYDITGNVGWSEDANGLRTEFTYDPL